MWATVLLLAIVAVAKAENGWKAGTKYTYEIHGRTLTGMHQLRKQYSGVLVAANLTLIAETDSKLTLQVLEGKYAKINRYLEEGWTAHIPDEEVNYNPLELESSSFQLHLKNGVVDKMLVEKDLPSWQVNFLKAVASQFQVDTRAENLKNSKWNDVPSGEQENGLYKTLEDSVNGVYETLYEVYPLPDYIIQSRPELEPLPYLRENRHVYSVDKSRNFSSGDQHVVYRYGLSGREGWNEGTNQMGNIIARTSNSRIVITGDLDEYTIQYSDTTEKVLVAPHMSNSLKGMVGSRLTVVLQSMAPFLEESPSIKNPRTLENLVYEYEEGELNSGNEAKDALGSRKSQEDKLSENISLKGESGEDDSVQDGPMRYKDSSVETNSGRQLFAGGLLDKRSNLNQVKQRSTTDISDEKNSIKVQSATIRSPKDTSAEDCMSLSKSIMKDSRPKRIRRIAEWLVQEGQRQSSEKKRKQSYSGKYSLPPSSSSDEEAPIDSSKEYLQSKPSMDGTPNIEFLPDSVLSHSLGKDQIIEKIVKAARHIGQTVLDPNNIVTKNLLTYFSILSRLMSVANSQQLQAAADKLNYNKTTDHEPESEKEYQFLLKQQSWIAFRDAVSAAGTGPALKALNAMIKSGAVSGEEAAVLISQLPASARYPTTEYMNYFFEMVKSSEVENQNHLNTSALMAFTDLVRKSQVDQLSSRHRYSIHLIQTESESHSSAVAGAYLPYLHRKLKDAVASGDSVRTQVYIRAIGNTAHRQILAIYEPYLEGKIRITNFQRLLMVTSLDEMTRVYPNSAQAVLYRIYQNQGEIAEVRVAAVMMLMKTNPSAQLLQQMAEQTNSDRSKDVRAAVKSAIESAANGVLAASPEMVRNALSAANLLTTENFQEKHSEIVMRSFLARQLDTLKSEGLLSSVQSLDGQFPSSLMYSMQRNIGGYMRDPQTVSFMSSSSEDLISLMFNQMKKVEKSEKVVHEDQESDYNYRKIYDIINGQFRTQNQVEGNMLFSVFGTKRFFAFDNRTFEDMPKIIQEIQGTLSKRLYLYHSKYFNQESVEVGFPMAMGLRFTYSYESPSFQYFGIQGTGHFEQQGPLEQGTFPFNIGFKGYYRYIQANQRSAKMAFVFGQERYITGFEKIGYINVPLKGTLELNGTQKCIKASLKPPSYSNEPQKLLAYRTDVYTTYQNITDEKPCLEGAHVKHVRSEPTKTYHSTLGKEQTGYAFQVDIKNEKSFLSIYKAAKGINYPPTDILDLMSHLDDTVSNSDVAVSYDPKRSEHHRTELSLSLNTEEKRGDEGAGGLSRKTPGNSAQPTSMRKRVRELLRNADGGARGGAAAAADALVSFGGNHSERTHCVTFAAGGSPVSQVKRYLLYYKGTPAREGTKGFEVAVDITAKKPYMSNFNYGVAVNTDPTVHIDGKVNFNKSADPSITFQILAERSHERKRFVQEQPLAALCLRQMERGQYLGHPCREASSSLAGLDKYRLSLRYQDVPSEVRRWAYRLYSLGRHLAYRHSSESTVDVRNPQGQLDGGVKFSTDFKSVNVTLRTPSMDSHFENIVTDEIPYMIGLSKYRYIQHFKRLISSSELKGVCSLDATTVTTFDNKTYAVNLGDCYYVLTMFAPPRSSLGNKTEYSETHDYGRKYFAILAKENDSRKKVIKIVLGGDAVTMQPAPGSGVSMSYNGRSIEVTESDVTRWEGGTEVYRAYVQPRSHIAVFESLRHGLRVTYDGERAQIGLPASYRNRVRGVCGTFDGEQEDDFTGPTGCLVRGPEQLVEAYSVGGATCSGAEHKPRGEGGTCLRRVTWTDVVSDAQAGRGVPPGFKGRYKKAKDTGRANEGCTDHKVMIVKAEGGKTCFSMKPQVVCSAHCSGKGSIEKKIDFHCMSESSATRHWVTMVNKGANPDFTQRKSNHQMSIKLPEKCVAPK